MLDPRGSSTEALKGTCVGLEVVRPSSKSDCATAAKGGSVCPLAGDCGPYSTGSRSNKGTVGPSRWPCRSRSRREPSGGRPVLSSALMGWVGWTQQPGMTDETLTLHARFRLHACRLHRCTVVTPIGMVATSLTVVTPIGMAVTSQAAVTALTVTSLHACQWWAGARPYSRLT
jgi:hypothetical protein